jgi:hypothetical protein
MKKIVESDNQWTPSETDPSHHFRFGTKRGGKVLFRKVIDPAAFGGYTIHSIAHPSLRSLEWINTHFTRGEK